MIAPTFGRQGISDKYVTGVTKVKTIRDREDISIGTWYVRVHVPARQLVELFYEIVRYY